jgi:transposase-like protein
MPQPYPKEFRDDVIRVVQTRDSKTTIGQIAKDFGVHEGTINKWLRQAEIDAGNKPATPATSPPNYERCVGAIVCLSRRTRSCAARPRICHRRICRQKALPARERARRRRDPRGGVVPGLEALPPALLPVAGSTHP